MGYCVLVPYFPPDLQRKSNDPNRFQNRGGQLQKELKMKKQTMKELPKVHTHQFCDMKVHMTHKGRSLARQYDHILIVR